ncbi:hypothetical protein MOTE_09970 [Moorella thermoacetica]|uniref:Flp/Fap pilin component n=1 Tax=Neomoorella thermoacetica TaxID=1525 RepID=A0A1J5P7B5_NEOTH|nr:hypothetical protein MOTE_09970 [Moorella thermoacetica]
MHPSAKNMFLDERGNTFLENALWIILFTLAVGTMIGSLATATKGKIQEMIDRISGVGTP